MSIQVIAVEGMPEVAAGDDVAGLIAARTALQDGDVVVVTQKIVSKAEGRMVAIDAADADAERARWAERESVRIVARRGPVIIAETAHGFVCANAGVDASNVPRGWLALLPADPDASAARIRDGLRAAAGADVGVIVSDTFGRAWRNGQIDVAIGAAGIVPIRDYVGVEDTFGTPMHSTQIAVADEIAGAAELVMGKVGGVPVAIVRGLDVRGNGTARMLIRPPEDDLFRTGATEP
ncbi:MAG TPA: coenzyme F420-0:L-glutamate ligase [Actinomycetota bacterium]